jgi:hypothetical protein
MRLRPRALKVDEMHAVHLRGTHIGREDFKKIAAGAFVEGLLACPETVELGGR